jgi:archaetidylinositol phosphate synthase
MVRRVHSGILASAESSVIGYAMPRIPAWVMPDHLTLLAASGAVFASVGLVLCGFSGWFLIAVVLGLVCNWIGDSFDGALARYRRTERHRVGFLLDRSCDMLSFFCIFVAFALSPYTTSCSALLFLLAYMLHTFYAMMRVVVDGVHEIGVGGFGATEGRLVIAGWALFAQLLGPERIAARINGVAVLDALTGALLLSAFTFFLYRLMRDVRRLARLEAFREFRRARNASADDVVTVMRPARSNTSA